MKVNNNLVLQQGFNQSTYDYQQSSALFNRISDELIDRLGWLKIQPKVIADLGCGQGYLTNRLATLYKDAKIIGIDWADQRLTLNNPPTNCHYICADLATGYIPAQSIDLIVSSLLLPWLPLNTALGHKWLNALSPNGAILCSTIGPDSWQELRQLLTNTNSQANFYAFPDLHYIGDWLTHSGFHDPVVDQVNITLQYPSYLTMLKHLQALGPGLVDSTPGYISKYSMQELGKPQLATTTVAIIFALAYHKKSHSFRDHNHNVHIPIDSIKQI